MPEHRKFEQVTAKAHANIALIKYWGKRDEELFLPMNSSLSITLDKFYTETSVQFCGKLKKDVFIFNNNIADEAETTKVSNYLNQIRKMAGVERYAMVQSVNHVPTAAGFASSASGYAALASAAVRAIGLDIDQKKLTQVARIGSGSACRSIYGGFVEWTKGNLEDGSDCYAKQLENEDYWDLSILAIQLSAEEKSLSSRAGMKLTVDTSPYYEIWVKEAQKDLGTLKDALHHKDFEQLGQVTESNALKMHATTLGANPPHWYWEAGTISVMNQVRKLRDSGIPAYFTMDAGPNVFVLCQKKDQEVVEQTLLTLKEVQKIYVCQPGPGVSYLAK
ncbi:diphosphomevalonate decarboxylase [Sporosarcina ureilytica]|uniref:diphosphomevalonate decarboxylase n=1 Tax=Sporosarcina ureilytica TaxID=298596 RepID=A0A1D8JK54_9BACL|nr:diphosphomevalonate decarboxylase [Sporosarcina ureilytica]AOV09063.1 diphosphomevalonate decarboxylase [Sporosarcina ureilytica]